MSALLREAGGGAHWGRSWPVAGDRWPPWWPRAWAPEAHAWTWPQAPAGLLSRWAASAGDFTPLSLAFLSGGVTGARRSEGRCESVTGTALSTVTAPSSELSRGGEESTETVPEDIHLEPEWMPPRAGH